MGKHNIFFVTHGRRVLDVTDVVADLDGAGERSVKHPTVPTRAAYMEDCAGRFTVQTSWLPFCVGKLSSYGLSHELNALVTRQDTVLTAVAPG